MDKPKKAKSLHEEVGWFVWGLLGIGAVWFFMGGAQNESARQGPYIKPLAPLDSGETYGGFYAGGLDADKDRLNLPQTPGKIIKGAEEGIRDFFTRSNTGVQNVSQATFLSKTVFLDGTAGAEASEPQEEYLRIVATPQADKNVSLAGMSLRGGALGTDVNIPEATDLLVLGTPTLKTSVSLPPTGRAIVSSGRSPVGTSFRVNICTGYLDQFQTFTPALRQECPEPVAELEADGPYEEDACRAFVKTLPHCRAFDGTFPDDISASCKAFVTRSLNYNSCVARSEKTEGFYKNEWRLFLDKTKELWKNKQEVIKLLDARGNAVDAITY
jgi:hypothetical protein